ncbi:hypothetical protein [Sabulibacter ruber]|uniref:hypothetical protein n=1 Tax=Sabulibacter ruber TaxID=2811901 RepID=UPI001A96575E|nr:hypothetical protein [Sabulibacter ruber]
MAAFQEMVASDRFPIENESDDFLEVEKEWIYDLPNRIDHYVDFMKETLKLEFAEIDQDVVVTCLKKVVGRRIRKVVTQREVVIPSYQVSMNRLWKAVPR